MKQLHNFDLLGIDFTIYNVNYNVYCGELQWQLVANVAMMQLHSYTVAVLTSLVALA